MKKVEPEAPKRHFSIAEIEAMHKSYDSERVLVVLKDGVWTVREGDSTMRNIDGTSARMRWTKDVMDFPKYLRTKVK
jgi:hypothetical protein